MLGHPAGIAHEHGQGHLRPERDQVDGMHGLRRQPGTDDHGGKMRDVGHHLRGALQQAVQLVVHAQEEALDLGLDGGAQPIGGQVIHVVAVPQVAGHPARGDVGLDDIALALQRRQVVAHGGAGNRQPAVVEHGA